MTKRKTKTQKLLTILSSGKEFKAFSLARRTGLMNVSSTINRLRNQGFSIDTNYRKEGPVYRWNV